MAMSDYEKSKFRFSETFNNANGKTSGSGFIGVIGSIIALIGFLIGATGWILGLVGVNIILTQSILLMTISSGLLTARKVAGAFQKPPPQLPNNEEVDK